VPQHQELRRRQAVMIALSLRCCSPATRGSTSRPH